MIATALLCLWLSVSAEPLENVISNGTFEKVTAGKPAGWNALWTRESGVGELTLDGKERRGGKQSVRVAHRGTQDWCVNTERKLSVTPGDLFQLEGWIKVEGKGSATLCVVIYDGSGKVQDWSFGAGTAQGSSPWRQVRSRFVIPRDTRAILPRILGVGQAKVWVDEVSLRKEGNVKEMRQRDLPETLSVDNEWIRVTLRTADATLAVTNKRTGTTWKQQPRRTGPVLLSARVDKSLEMVCLQTQSGLKIKVTLTLEKSRPECVIDLAAEGELGAPLCFPHPFVGKLGSYLVLPMNEGISYPVEDATIRPMRLIAYGGHGICMGFWGVTDGKEGHMAIIETPDDAAVRVARLQGNLCIAPEWDPQKGHFGDKRRLRYVFLDGGGHVGICKRYRQHAKQVGLFKTLLEKRQENPHVDLLIGAVNVWCWERNALSIVQELQSLGIDRILWSHRRSPDVIQAMNEMGGVLTSRYDIYQDLMDPVVVKEQLRGRHPDWTQDAWPQDLMLDHRGEWRKGWRVKGKDGQMHPCGVLCDARAPAYARKRVPQELKTHPYRSRFIDTTTAASWRECYHPDHPMTRSESRRAKMELLRFMSEETGLVTGSETGHEAAVPYVHYFEGMLSLGPYRIPDAGRRMIEVVQDIPERVAKFQVGEKYRLPLWELVYHDCVVAQWYWGDYNNKLPALWDKRDLFNLLYGTPPMFMFNRQIWQRNRDRFVQSYKMICPVVRQVGTAEMVDHRFLTPDRAVQQTRFAGGITISVNFGAKPYQMPNGRTLPPLGHHVAGLEE